MIKVEKRLPFGFLGLWSKLYKKYDFDQEEEFNSEIVEYNKTNYVALTMPIQIKKIEEVEKSKQRLLADLTTIGDNLIVKTTDCYYNKQEQDYQCIVNVDDLLQFENNWWLVGKILERNIYTPRKQSFYYIQLKKVTKENICVK